MLVIHDKSKYCAADATTEAVKRLPLRADMKRRCLLLVKRTERLEIRARSLERKIGADHLNDIIRRGDLFNDLCRNGAHYNGFFTRSDEEAMSNLPSAARFPKYETDSAHWDARAGA